MTTETKTILITGASTGFGRIASEKLARRGHHVFAGMRGTGGKNKEHATALQALASAEGLKLEAVELDVTSDSSVESAAAWVLGKAERLDVVINNAGIYASGLTEAHTPEDFTRIFDVNVLGVQRVNRAFAPKLREQGGGLVIYTSSVVGRVVLPFAAAYVSSKYALEGLIEAWRQETALLGIEHVSVQPGGFVTEIFGKVAAASDASREEGYPELLKFRERFSAAFGQMVTAPDWQKPVEVADAFVRLVEAPAGSRPFSVVVDRLGGPINTINETAAAVQEEFLRTFNAAELRARPEAVAV